MARLNIIKMALFCFVVLCCFSFCQRQAKHVSPIPADSRQMVLVITDSTDDSDGFLIRFERNDTETGWQENSEKISVIIGRSGLGWGRGFHKMSTDDLPRKQEGDGRSPAGIFALSSVFGYTEEEKMDGLKIPYIHITEMIECVDDVNSKYYNSILHRNEVDSVDWQSSEKMRHYKIWYAAGVVVDHNKNPVENGAGSCIFLHNWDGPDDSTSGCTVMSPENMHEVVYWLDESKNPVLVQITKALYLKIKEEW